MNFESVLRYYQCVNNLSRTLLARPAFDELHVTLPDPASPEPGFIRATSWLYCLYFEAGRVSLTLLRQLGYAYSLVDREASEMHVELVRCLRTELHHNLGFADSDQAARTAAEVWRRKACGTAIPRDDGQWRSCYERLVAEASDFLKGIDEVVRRIEADGDGAAMHVEEWLRRLERTRPAATFDRLIDNAKYRLGRDAMNTVVFRRRHLDRWRKQIELLEDGFDFEYEATRLIEKTLLDEDSLIVPITGRDIIESLNVKPGPEVGALLEAARKHFESTPCTKEELLLYLEREGLSKAVT
ncbi:hypothetical protein [Thiohalocapsa sp. ML1]|jgi:hypothetical protein|uniref:hypothetical protein n=1 Tax=Thiohalocapsa sp. ML1 TaxID=1431688 RepID=UPI000AEFBD13|nr:hypothetical protein [Thiohalocapsa sp. ML1]